MKSSISDTRNPGRPALFSLLALCVSLAVMPVTALAQTLPTHLLYGYWQNWSPGAIRLIDVPTTYDVIAVAFAIQDSTPGEASFALDSGVSSQLGGYTQADFIADIAACKARGQTVLISCGGATGNIVVNSSASATNFANSVNSLMAQYGFQGVDIDFESGINVTYLTQALKAIKSGSIITMAPQTTDVENTSSPYFALALNISNILTICNTQYYNSGTMYGYDGKIYTDGTVDFITALATILLQDGLRPDQVGLGVPADSAAGSGYVSPSVVNEAVGILATGAAGGTYRPPQTYPTLRGVMTWSINIDATQGYSLANTVSPYLRSLGGGGGTTTVATPSFNPGGGSYTSAQNVTISDSTSGASIRYTTDGSTPTSTTGTIYSGPVNISSTATLKAIGYKSGDTNSSVASATYTIGGGSSSEGPYGGSPAAIPGTVQAENYDTGGQGVAYNVSSINGSDNGYRSDGVDLEASSDTGGGVDLGWTTGGQWFKYTVNVATAGTYKVSFRVAAPGAVTDAFHLSNSSGTNLSGSVSLPATGGYQTWTTVTASVTLSAGQQVLTLDQDNGGWNLNYMTFATVSSGEAPYGGSPAAIPGTVQAENYDTGGQGVAYNVSSINGTDNGYRSDGVDLEASSDTGGGVDLGWTSPGQWFKYTVNVATAGTYTVSFRIAAPGAVTDAFHLSNSSGTNLSGNVNLPATGGYQTWATVTASVTLPAGQQILTLNEDNGNGVWNINYMSFATSGGTTTYTITANAGTGGSISPAGTVVVNSGASQSFTITPSSGYSVASVTVDGSSKGAITSYTFSNVTADHTISASFQTSGGTCVTAKAGSSWQNSAMSSQTGTFTATFDATPSASPTNSVMALSNGAQTAYANFACLVRFNPSGDIDARNGGAYAAASTIPYSAGVSYHFSVVVNVSAKTYSIYVTPAGGSQQTVGLNYAFRISETALNYWGVFVDTTANGGAGTNTVCNFSP
jgi:chitinase